MFWYRILLHAANNYLAPVEFEEVNKKLGNYSNVLTRGGPVKVGKSK